MTERQFWFSVVYIYIAEKLSLWLFPPCLWNVLISGMVGVVAGMMVGHLTRKKDC